MINLFSRNKSNSNTIIELNEKSPMNRKDLMEYFNKKCLLSCYSKLLLDMTGKNFNEKSICSEIKTFINNPRNKIYFVSMNELMPSFMFYDGTIFLNKKIYDLMKSKIKEKIQFGKCQLLLSIFHEMANLLAFKIMGAVKIYSFFKSRKDITEEVGEYFEEILLGRKKRQRVTQGKKITYTTMNVFSLKNAKYINNLKNYPVNYTRFNKAFLKIYKENPISSKDVENETCMKYQKTNFNTPLAKNKIEFFFPFRRKLQ